MRGVRGVGGGGAQKERGIRRRGAISENRLGADVCGVRVSGVEWSEGATSEITDIRSVGFRHLTPAQVMWLNRLNGLSMILLESEKHTKIDPCLF